MSKTNKRMNFPKIYPGHQSAIKLWISLARFLPISLISPEVESSLELEHKNNKLLYTKLKLFLKDRISNEVP